MSIEKLPDSCLPPKDVLASLGFETIDEPAPNKAQSRTTHTGNGYDPRWIACINTVLEDRETGIQISDILEGLWDEHIGPMIDAIEDGYARPKGQNGGLVEYEV